MRGSACPQDHKRKDSSLRFATHRFLPGVAGRAPFKEDLYRCDESSSWAESGFGVSGCSVTAEAGTGDPTFLDITGEESLVGFRADKRPKATAAASQVSCCLTSVAFKSIVHQTSYHR